MWFVQFLIFCNIVEKSLSICFVWPIDCRSCHALTPVNILKILWDLYTLLGFTMVYYRLKMKFVPFLVRWQRQSKQLRYIILYDVKAFAKYFNITLFCTHSNRYTSLVCITRWLLHNMVCILCFVYLLERTK